jgi:hypothetical protein
MTPLSNTLLPPEPRSRTTPHKRLTAEQVKQHWLLGDYSASGYLIHLLSAFKRDGWIIEIANVSTFCQEWQIGERRFYRAKAKLIEQGRLGERIKGNLQLWLITDRVVPIDSELPLDDLDSQTDNFVSLTDEIVSEADEAVSVADSSDRSTDSSDSVTDSSDSATPFNSLLDKGSSDSPDLSQISIISSSSLSLSHPPSASEREAEADPELFDTTGQPIAPFREWLEKQSQKLPYPPALLGKWIEKQAKDSINQQEFLKFYRGSGRTKIPLVAIAHSFEASETEQTHQRLQTLRHWWAAGQRERVEDAIATHPEWQLIVGEMGPQEVEP